MVRGKNEFANAHGLHILSYIQTGNPETALKAIKKNKNNTVLAELNRVPWHRPSYLILEKLISKRGEKDLNDLPYPIGSYKKTDFVMLDENKKDVQEVSFAHVLMEVLKICRNSNINKSEVSASLLDTIEYAEKTLHPDEAVTKWMKREVEKINISLSYAEINYAKKKEKQYYKNAYQTGTIHLWDIPEHLVEEVTFGIDKTRTYLDCKNPHLIP